MRRLEACGRLRLAEDVVSRLPGVGVMVKSASEMHKQSLAFVLVAAGEERKEKKMDLGFQ